LSPLSVYITLLVCHNSRAALKREHKRAKTHSAVFDMGQEKQKAEKKRGQFSLPVTNFHTCAGHFSTPFFQHLLIEIIIFSAYKKTIKRK